MLFPTKLYDDPVSFLDKEGRRGLTRNGLETRKKKKGVASISNPSYTNEEDDDEVFKSDTCRSRGSVDIFASDLSFRRKSDNDIRKQRDSTEKSRLSFDASFDQCGKSFTDASTPLLAASDLRRNSNAKALPSILKSRQDCSDSNILKERPGSSQSIYTCDSLKDQEEEEGSPQHVRLRSSSSSPLPSISSPLNPSHHRHHLHHYPLHYQKSAQVRLSNSNTSDVRVNQITDQKCKETVDQNKTKSSIPSRFTEVRIESLSSSSNGSLGFISDSNAPFGICSFDTTNKNADKKKTGNDGDVSIEMTPTMTRTVSSTSNDTASAVSTSELSDHYNFEISESSQSSPTNAAPTSPESLVEKAPHSAIEVEKESDSSCARQNIDTIASS